LSSLCLLPLKGKREQGKEKGALQPSSFSVILFALVMGDLSEKKKKGGEGGKKGQ